MNKILLIIQREFITRVRKKSFLLTTILLPVIIFSIYIAIFYFMMYDKTTTTIAVVDETHLFKDTIPGNKDIIFVFLPQQSQQDLSVALTKKNFDGYIITQDSLHANNPIELVTQESLSLSTRMLIDEKINDRLRALHIQKMSPAQQEAILIESSRRAIKFTSQTGDEQSNLKAGVSYGVGMISGYLIFFILLLYGTIVMRGVMEEKTNRIAEVIVSSVKPFHLMMGKIIGIGAVGLVQFMIWILLVTGLLQIGTLFMTTENLSSLQNNGLNIDDFPAILQQIKGVNFALIISIFILYFIGGYLLYASLYAVVGCAVSESEEDAQKLTLPITLPLIIGFVMLTKVIDAPNSSLAVFGSLFPLTSPIIMLGRVTQGVPEGVPVWQLIVSILLLISTFIGAAYMAARVYRVGILMYGKKPSWKEIIKWVRRR